MIKSYYLLKFECTGLSCDNGKIRLDQMKFDILGKGNCKECGGRDFQIIKERISEEYKEELENSNPKLQVVLIETRELIKH